MITKDLLRAIRNDLPMKLTIVRLGRHGPIAKHSDGYFRFQCPRCSELTRQPSMASIPAERQRSAAALQAGMCSTAPGSGRLGSLRGRYRPL